jgi:small-conductance mechanosensitive channel
LESIKRSVNEKHSALQPEADLTTKGIERWTITKDELNIKDVPEPIWERIESVLIETTELNKVISDKQYSLLVQEDRVTSMIIAVDEVMDKINEKMQDEKGQFFTLDSPPIWSIFTADDDTISVLAKAKDSFESQKKDFGNFRKNYQKNIRNHILTFLIIVLILIYLRHRVDKWSIQLENEKTKTSIYVINRPFMVALTIALLITLYYYPEAPQTVINLIYLLSIIPILFLLPGMFPNFKRIYIYLFAVLFLLSEVSLFFERYYILDRISLLIFDLFAIGAFIYSIRPQSSLIIELRAMGMRFAITLLNLIFIFILIGTISNILGNTVLSNSLSHGAFITYFSGVLIYTGSKILKSFVHLLTLSNLSKTLNVLQKYPKEISKGLINVINIGAAFYWIYVVLDLFLIYDPIVKWIMGIITKPWQIGEVVFTIGSFLAFFITIWISVFLSKIIRILLQDEILVRFDMKRGMPGAISMMVRISLITIGIILACSAAGIRLSDITIIFGALGVGVGFGLQDIVKNFISGLIIAFERPLQKGDVIQIATLNLMGTIQEIGIRSSIIKTYDGAEVVVPNGNLISSEMINWTLSNRDSRREILIGVKYGTDIQKVLKILHETVDQQENVYKNPPPWIIFSEFGDSSLNFRVTFWTKFDVGLSIKSVVGAAIDEAFKKEGIEIPFPQRDLHLRSTVDHNEETANDDKMIT